MRWSTRFVVVVLMLTTVARPLRSPLFAGESKGAKTRSSDRKLALARRWDAVKLDVGQAYVGMFPAFHRSVSHWQERAPDLEGGGFHEGGNLSSPQAFAKEAAVLIDGDCLAKLTVPKGGMVHIQGDLAKTIAIGDQGEIVIGGSVLPGAVIEADGIQEIFVEGDLNGKIHSLGSLKVSVGGTFGGTIFTGDPSTNLSIRGDYKGQLKPQRTAALLFLDVAGFMPYSALEAISAQRYTEFDAYLGVSDRPPGIYPSQAENKRPINLIRPLNSCWTIRARK